MYYASFLSKGWNSILVHQQSIFCYKVDQNTHGLCSIWIGWWYRLYSCCMFIWRCLISPYKKILGDFVLYILFLSFLSFYFTQRQVYSERQPKIWLSNNTLLLTGFKKNWMFIELFIFWLENRFCLTKFILYRNMQVACV